MSMRLLCCVVRQVADSASQARHPKCFSVLHYLKLGTNSMCEGNHARRMVLILSLDHAENYELHLGPLK